MTGIASKALFFAWYKINFEKKSKIDLLQNSEIFFRMMMTKVRGVLREEKNWQVLIVSAAGQFSLAFKASKFLKNMKSSRPQNSPKTSFFSLMKSLRKFKYNSDIRKTKSYNFEFFRIFIMMVKVHKANFSPARGTVPPTTDFKSPTKKAPWRV